MKTASRIKMGKSLLAFISVVLLVSMACSLPINFNPGETTPPPVSLTDEAQLPLEPTAPPQPTEIPAGPIPLEDAVIGTWSVFTANTNFASELSTEEAQTWVGNLAEIGSNTIRFNQTYCLVNNFQRSVLPADYREQIGVDLEAYGINPENTAWLETDCSGTPFARFIQIDGSTLLLSSQGGYFWLQRLAPEAPNRAELYAKIYRADNPPLWEIFAQVPQVTDQSPNAEAFNAAAELKTTGVLNAFIEDLENAEEPPDPNFPPSDMLITYQVNWNDGSRISILQTVSFYYAGAAHPNMYFLTFNYDLANRQELLLEDIFQPGSDYLNFLLSSAEEALYARDIGYFESLTTSPEDYRSFTFSKQGLFLHFDPYHVAAYAAGPQNVLIPYEELTAYLRPEYLPPPTP